MQASARRLDPPAYLSGPAILAGFALVASRRHPFSPLVVGENAGGNHHEPDNDENCLHTGAAARYLRPTTMTLKLPGRIVGRGRGLSAVGAGRGPNSAVTR